MPGMNSSQIEAPSVFFMGWLPGFQLLKSPTTLTAVAWGAHRRNMTPFSPPCSSRWDPKKRWASKLLPCLYR